MWGHVEPGLRDFAGTEVVAHGGTSVARCRSGTSVDQIGALRNTGGGQAKISDEIRTSVEKMEHWRYVLAHAQIPSTRHRPAGADARGRPRNPERRRRHHAAHRSH